MKYAFPLPLVVLMFTLAAPPARADQALPELQVMAPEDGRAASEWLPRAPERGSARILGAKKTTSVPVSARPAVIDQAPRQALADIAGLNVSEVSNQSLSSFNFRGLGDPHESFFVQILEDNVPIAADPYGYPANYYSPPLPGVESAEFFRGGAALLFGPQPGGALHYRTRTLNPRLTPWGARSEQSFGSFGFFSSFNEVQGSPFGLSTRATYARRSSDGFRARNQDYGVDYAQLKTSYTLGDRTVGTTKLDFYSANHGEPGGLALASGTNVRGIDQGFRQTTLDNDRLEIERVAVVQSLESEWSARTQTAAEVFWIRYRRDSFRQTLGGSPTFGGVALGTTNAIQEQTFHNLGLNARLRHSLGLDSSQSVRYTLGLSLFRSASDYTQSQGASPTARTGTRQLDVDRLSASAGVFSELEWSFAESWKLVPGLRVDRIVQCIAIPESIGGSFPGVGGRTSAVWVPLAGLGAEYSGLSAGDVYANSSPGYRPVQFSEAVPLATNVTIANELKPSRSWMHELGVRSKASQASQWDLSAFYITYDNQIGRSGTQIVNTGAARHWGAEASATSAPLGSGTRVGATLAWLRARYTGGPFDGRTPQYAPSLSARIRLEQKISDRARVQLLGTGVTDHFGDDSNTVAQRVLGYGVWDLASEAELIPGRLTFLANIQNLFNKKYWSRVRANGIDPAAPFTVQAGIRWTL